MKQKYSIIIADVQLDFTSDATPAEVEKIRGLLDRKMREIYLKSSHCPKTKAAMLCAMEFVAERTTHMERIAELEELCEKHVTELDGLRSRDADNVAELERLRTENAVLRSLISADQVPANISPDPISPTDFLAEVAEAQSDAPVSVEPEAPPADDTPRKPRSRVGSMFDLLSFSETD